MPPKGTGDQPKKPSKTNGETKASNAPKKVGTSANEPVEEFFNAMKWVHLGRNNYNAGNVEGAILALKSGITELDTLIKKTRTNFPDSQDDMLRLCSDAQSHLARCYKDTDQQEKIPEILNAAREARILIHEPTDVDKEFLRQFDTAPADQKDDAKVVTPEILIKTAKEFLSLGLDARKSDPKQACQHFAAGLAHTYEALENCTQGSPVFQTATRLVLQFKKNIAKNISPEDIASDGSVTFVASVPSSANKQALPEYKSSVSENKAVDKSTPFYALLDTNPLLLCTEGIIGHFVSAQTESKKIAADSADIHAYFKRGVYYQQCALIFALGDSPGLGNFFNNLAGQDWQMAKQNQTKDNQLTHDQLKKISESAKKSYSKADKKQSIKNKLLKMPDNFKAIRDSIKVLIEQGKSAFADGKIADCVKLFEQAYEPLLDNMPHTPLFAQLFYETALLCKNDKTTNRHVYAYEMLCVAINSNPNHAKALFQQGILYRKFATEFQPHCAHLAQAALNAAFEVMQRAQNIPLRTCTPETAIDIEHTQIQEFIAAYNQQSQQNVDALGAELAAEEKSKKKREKNKKGTGIQKISPSAGPSNGVPADVTAPKKTPKTFAPELSAVEQQKIVLEQKRADEQKKALQQKQTVEKGFRQRLKDYESQILADIKKAEEKRDLKRLVIAKANIAHALPVIDRLEKEIKADVKELRATFDGYQFKIYKLNADHLFSQKRYDECLPLYEAALKLIGAQDPAKAVIEKNINIAKRKQEALERPLSAEQILAEILRLAPAPKVEPKPPTKGNAVEKKPAATQETKIETPQNPVIKNQAATETKHELIIDAGFLTALEAKMGTLQNLAHEDFAGSEACLKLIPRLLASPKAFEIIIKLPNLLGRLFPDFCKPNSTEVPLSAQMQAKILGFIKIAIVPLSQKESSNGIDFYKASALILAAIQFPGIKYPQTKQDVFNHIKQSRTAKLLEKCDALQGNFGWEGRTFGNFKLLLDELHPLLYDNYAPSVKSTRPKTADLVRVDLLHSVQPQHLLHYPPIFQPMSQQPFVQRQVQNATAESPQQTTNSVIPQLKI